MSISFTRKTVAMMLIALIGVDFAVVGQYHESPLVLGLGLALMGSTSRHPPASGYSSM
jgi:hypothetical protein